MVAKIAGYGYVAMIWSKIKAPAVIQLQGKCV